MEGREGGGTVPGARTKRQMGRKSGVSASRYSVLLVNGRYLIAQCHSFRQPFRAKGGGSMQEALYLKEGSLCYSSVSSSYTVLSLLEAFGQECCVVFSLLVLAKQSFLCCSMSLMEDRAEGLTTYHASSLIRNEDPSIIQ